MQQIKVAILNALRSTYWRLTGVRQGVSMGANIRGCRKVHHGESLPCSPLSTSKSSQGPIANSRHSDHQSRSGAGRAKVEQ